MIDVVVVNYRTPADLQKFLTSLKRFEPSDYTLTIVDVGATNDFYVEHATPTEACRMRRWFGFVDNIGYARACNLATADGEGDVLALFNADVQVTEKAVDRCGEELLAHTNWAVLGPRQIDSKGRIRHAGIFGTNDRPVHRGWAQVAGDNFCDVREAVTVSGSAYFVKRTVWDELTACPLYQQMAPGARGAFLPTAHYYEESWTSYHARDHGHKVMYFGEVTMVHEWHQASPVGGWAEQQIGASQAYFRAACAHHRIICD